MQYGVSSWRNCSPGIQKSNQRLAPPQTNSRRCRGGCACCDCQAQPDLLQWPQLDVLVPAVAAVILQADVAFAGMVLVGDVELVRRPVGPLVLFGPLVEVHVRDLLAVELDVDQILVAGDGDVV